MKNKKITLYNVMFPLWLLPFIGVFLGSLNGVLLTLIVVVSNFIVDTLVYYIAALTHSRENINENYKKCILKIWLFGFLADIIGVIPMFAVNFLAEIQMETTAKQWLLKNFINAVAFNPFESIISFVWVVLCVLISMYFIYLFNYKISFKKLEIEQEKKKKMALILAIATAPYMFLVPSTFLYS